MVNLIIFKEKAPFKFHFPLINALASASLLFKSLQVPSPHLDSLFEKNKISIKLL